MGWRYQVGLGFIGLFVFVWVASAEITQRIFEEYKQPFALTYLGVSLMVVYLPVSVFKVWICSLLKNLYRELHKDTGLNIPLGISENYQTPGTDLRSCLITDKNISEREEGKPLLIKIDEDKSGLLEQNNEFSSWKIAKCSLYLTPIWFSSEYLSNLALLNTSVTSTTVLSSTSSLFTLFFGALLGQDSVNITKMIAVLISMAGVAMTTVGKTWAADGRPGISEKHCIIGVTFGLLSAICYGLFTVLLKKYVGSKGEKVDMQKVLGCIGLYSLLGFWWLALPLSAAGIEPHFKFPSSRPIAEMVIANSFWSSVISDYFWALSVVWTTPLVATLGMSLTIPLAMIADMLVHGRHYSAIYILGCIQVFAGFVLANLSDKFSGNSQS
ncbi:hypothetical protein L6164_024399 [Bauhinia variegata]|uniref:Uncharacterized protein n=1 Tax=Bauhinia variegata TaxID=167791 RepID=A0ACB9LXN7_BAUVA|nr:hypothetical protein L6164_024399 [Bauhinia variegata]